MKKVFFIIGMLLSLGMFCACSSDDEKNSPDSSTGIEKSSCSEGDKSQLNGDSLEISDDMDISQELAWMIVKTRVLNNQLEDVNVYVSNEIIQPNVIVETIFTDETKEISPIYPSWLFFIDDIPYGNWSHQCRYVYLNVMGGKYEIHPFNWPPTYLESDFTPLVMKPIVPFEP